MSEIELFEGGGTSAVEIVTKIKSGERVVILTRDLAKFLDELDRRNLNFSIFVSRDKDRTTLSQNDE